MTHTGIKYSPVNPDLVAARNATNEQYRVRQLCEQRGTADALQHANERLVIMRANERRAARAAHMATMADLQKNYYR